MFGDEFVDEQGRIVRICCGPRCGAETEHRRIYAALEAVVKSRSEDRPEGALTIRPAMCQGYCGMGVTVVTAEGAWIKIRAASEARDIKLTSEEIETCPQ